MPLDPNIILGIGDLNNPDRAAQAKLNALKLLSAQQEMKGQNALRQMFGNPQNFDPSTGAMTPNALRQVGTVNPDWYFTLAKNNLDMQKAQVELQDKYTGLIDDAGLPAALAYDSTLKSTGSKEAAQQAAQTAWDGARKDLVTSGHLPGEIADRLPNQFNPDLFKAKSKQYQAFRKEEDTERHQEAMEALTARGQNIRVETGGEAGWDVFVDPKSQTPYRLNKRTGEAVDFQGNPYVPAGVQKPAGGTPRSPAAMFVQKYMEEHPEATAEDLAKAAASFQGQVRSNVAFDVGKQGDTVRSLNVAIQHINLMEQLSSALGNNDVQTINRVKNALKEEFGDADVTNFDVAKGIVGDEIVKSVVGSGAALADRENAQNQISRAKSWPQLIGALKTAKQLMAGQLKGLKRQYESSTGKTDFDEKLDPTTKKELEDGDSTARVATPQSKSEYDALPKGTHYRKPGDPGGSYRVKQ